MSELEDFIERTVSQSYMRVDSFGISHKMPDPPPFTRLASRYLRFPRWLRWALPRARREYRRCCVVREDAWYAHVIAHAEEMLKGDWRKDTEFWGCARRENQVS